MPLRALFEGADVIAPLLSDQTWTTITQRVRHEPDICRLPCCDAPAYTRVSARGVRHFVHRAHDRCDASTAPESELHLRAKAIVAATLTALGYTARTEVAGAGWRADVLVDHTRPVAIEIQCAPQSAADFDARHARYARDGVRAVWFATHVPADLAPARRRPVFALEDHDGVPRVQLNGRAHALDAFVRALFTNQIRFCARARSARRQRIDTDVRRVVCPSCHASSLVWHHGGTVRTPCGLSLAEESWKPHDATGGFRPDVGAPATPPATVARTDGLGVPGVRFDSQRRFGGQYRALFVAAFCCSACGARFTPRLLQHQYFAYPSVARLHRELALAAPLYEVRPHWCLPRTPRNFCE
jgi:Competence protein CoiA-like family